jgi:beta-phosphoglucomutase-like phosphatase (HAD superfamily)
MMNLNLDIPDEPFDGYIFDCDGTLADTMPLHFQAWRATLDACGGEHLFPVEQFYAMGGVAPVDIIAQLNADHRLKLDAAVVAEAKEAAFLSRLHAVDAIEQVTSFARRMAHDHPVSVVSGGLKPIVLRTLELIEMAGVFDPIITPEDVERGKPHPDMFLLAAEKMGVAPENCLVFEDGQSGIDGAHAAGMQTVFIPTLPTRLQP